MGRTFLAEGVMSNSPETGLGWLQGGRALEQGLAFRCFPQLYRETAGTVRERKESS